MSRHALAYLAGVLALSGCSSTPPVPCAAPVVADYTVAMVKAGCIGAHFDDPRCATIKAKRDADEKAKGCL